MHKPRGSLRCRNICSNTRVIIFSLRKRRTGSLKIITSADIQFFAQNQMKSKKIKGHHVRRCPIFRPKSSEEQKKVITPAECADVQFFAQNQMKSKKKRKKSITPADAQFSNQNLVESKKKSSRPQAVV